jgi:hypothetical protein
MVLAVSLAHDATPRERDLVYSVMALYGTLAVPMPHPERAFTQFLMDVEAI